MKLPKWVFGIQMSLILYFFALFFASEDIAFWNLPYYQVTIYAATLLFVGCVGVGLWATISRRRKFAASRLKT